MKKVFFLLSSLFLLNGCAESVALLGGSVGGASNGKVLQSSFNSAICLIVKKQLNLTKSKIINEKKNESLKDLTSSLQPNININSKIKYLD